MSSFELYLKLGFHHIADLRGYDHILFVVALCALYGIHEWRKVAILVTAFTIGHSLTLALSTLNIVILPSALVEFLIPITILVTALFNMFQPSDPKNRIIKYSMALFFGLIHGLGFSNYLKALLGQEESIVQPLLAFNVGLEVGQLLIVAVVLFAGFLVVNLAGVKQRYWVYGLSLVAALFSLQLIIKNASAL